MEQESAVAENETRAMHFQISGRRDVEGLIVAVADIKGVINAKGETSRDGRPSESAG